MRRARLEWPRRSSTGWKTDETAVIIFCFERMRPVRPFCRKITSIAPNTPLMFLKGYIRGSWMGARPCMVRNSIPIRVARFSSARNNSSRRPPPCADQIHGHLGRMEQTIYSESFANNYTDEDPASSLTHRRKIKDPRRPFFFFFFFSQTQISTNYE